MISEESLTLIRELNFSAHPFRPGFRDVFYHMNRCRIDEPSIIFLTMFEHCM